MESTKERIYSYIDRATSADEDDLHDASHFSALGVAHALDISRSLASQYLNELHDEESLIKVATRPVMFYSRRALEGSVGGELQEHSYISVEELVQHLARLRSSQSIFDEMIGANGSLHEVIERACSAIMYPPKGLPYILVGEAGTGKHRLRALLSKFCVSKEVVKNLSCVVTIDASVDTEQVVTRLLGTPDNPAQGELYSDETKLFWVIHAECLSNEDVQHLLSYYDIGSLVEVDGTGAGSRLQLQATSRLFLVFSDNIAEVKARPWMNKAPMACAVPSYHELRPDEREAWVFAYFKAEGERIGYPVKVSSSVVRYLLEARFYDNLTGLGRTIRLMCAQALVDAEDELRVFPSYIPRGAYPAFTVSNSNDVAQLIDVAAYNPHQRSIVALSALLDFMKVCTGEASAELQVKEALTSFLDLVQRAQTLKLGVNVFAEHDMSDAIRSFFARVGMREPVNFAVQYQSCTHFFHTFSSVVATWYTQHEELVDRFSRLVQQKFAREYELLVRLNQYVHNTVGKHSNSVLQAVFSLYLNWYLGSNNTERILGVIVAHGLSTASSIADSVNTLLSTHVFDALDMPIDVQSDEIVARLQEFLAYPVPPREVLVMVDMGSLESMGETLASSLGITVGVINNISTPLALEAGSMILDNTSVEAICQRIAEVGTPRYSVVRSQSDTSCIVVLSENGAIAAARIVDLLISSLPHKIPVEIIGVDYFDFLRYGPKLAELEGRDILFALGTNDPQLEDVRYLAIDELVGSLDTRASIMNQDASFGLEKYLSPGELAEFRGNLVRNFSLENLMSHLTILEPKHLMGLVTTFIESLQRTLNLTLSYGALTRLYMHVGYLIERLVTKDVLNYGDPEAFAYEHPDFIVKIRGCFVSIANGYGVELPVSEANYLWDLIQLETDTETREVQAR